MGHVRPYVVQWNQEELTIFAYKITKDRFAKFLQEELTKLEVFVKTEVLLGISLDDLDIDCRIKNDMDDGDLQTDGRGAFLHEATLSLDNQDSRKFQRALAGVESDRGPVRKVKGALHWDKSKSTAWLLCINIAWQLTYCLMHSLGGLAGRAAEEVLYAWTNELFGSPSNIRIRGDTIALNTTYHKGALVTGMHKYVVRLLPYRLSSIIYILLRIVRPAELNPILKFYTTTGEEYATNVAKLYRTRIFASWGKGWTTDYMSTSLKSWFNTGLGIPMGIRMYRHLATALQRRYIQYIQHLQPEDIQAVADAQAGRTENTSEAHYAVEKKQREPSKKIREFELVSAYWHEMLGIDTYAPESKMSAQNELETDIVNEKTE